MSTKNSKETKSPARWSSETKYLELFIFACGHGDTLLVRLPDERWVLVDCYLPKHNGVRRRFFEFVDEQGIDHLALVFQTHPDYDHYLGMHDVLEHFTESEGKSVGLYVDGGLNAEQIKRLIVEPKRPGRDEYRKLQDALRRWHQQSVIVRHCGLDAERPPIFPKGFRNRIEFVPIAPDATMTRVLTEASLQKYGTIPKAKLEANELSIVLVLAVKDDANEFNVLLSADAGVESCKRALNVWREHTEENGISDRFNVIKVSHHGSIKNHRAELCELGTEDSPNNVAAISAGERSALPDRSVISDFMKADWKVMVTTVRKERRFDRVVGLHFKRGDQLSIAQHTIALRWNRGGQFTFGPSEALVSESDVNAYGTAKV